MPDLLDIMTDAKTTFYKALDSFPRVLGEELGLDPRIGRMWVDVENYLIITGARCDKSLRYYGGFEYVDEEYVTVFGDYTIYDGESERVTKAIDFYLSNNVENL